MESLEQKPDGTWRVITNKGVVEDLTGVPLLDHLIHGQDFLDAETYLKILSVDG